MLYEVLNTVAKNITSAPKMLTDYGAIAMFDF